MDIKDITRSEILTKNTNQLFIEIEVPFLEARNSSTDELVDLLIAPTLIISEREDELEKFQLPIDEEMFKEKRYKTFNNLTYSLGKLVRLAELNLDYLTKFVSLYSHFHSEEDLIERNSDCKELKNYKIKENFHKLTFGNLRNILSCIIKTDSSFHAIKGLTTKEERKNFTSVYNNYIIDRDRFTHGILFFKYPNYEPVIRVKISDESFYMTFSEDIFLHNIKTFQYLSSIIGEMRQLQQSKL